MTIMPAQEAKERADAIYAETRTVRLNRLANEWLLQLETAIRAMSTAGKYETLYYEIRHNKEANAYILDQIKAKLEPLGYELEVCVPDIEPAVTSLRVLWRNPKC